MSVNLQKGQRVSLSKDREGLSKIMGRTRLGRSGGKEARAFRVRRR